MNPTADRSLPAIGASVWSVGLIIAGSALLASLIEPHYCETEGATRPAVKIEQRESLERSVIERHLASATRAR